MLENLIQKELNRMDMHLFLDKEVHNGTLYYKVKHHASLGEPPLEVLSWSLGDYPLPLSFDIVEHVRRQEGDIRDAIRTATVNNAVRAAEQRKEFEDAVETLSKEFEKSSKRLHMSGPWKPGLDPTAYKKSKG